MIGSVTEPDLEKVLLLKPDLILGTSRFQNIYKQLSNIAPTVMITYPDTPPPWEQYLAELAKVLGKEEMGNQLINIDITFMFAPRC